MLNCKDIGGKQIYVGDMVNIMDSETEDWAVVPGTNQLMEAQVESIPHANTIEYNPINAGDIDVEESCKCRITYSLIHNLLHVGENMEEVMKEAEARFASLHTGRGKQKRTGSASKPAARKNSNVLSGVLDI